MTTPSISVTDNRYTIDGKEYPRLSVVTSQHVNVGLEEWRKRVGEEEAERVANEAAEYGTRVHLMTALADSKYTEAWIKADRLDILLELEPWLIPHWAAWSEWVKEYVKEIIAIEVVVWSNKYWCAGRVDRILKMKGDRSLSLWDLKTGSLSDDFGVDLAGYAYMWNERNRRKVKRRGVIHMPKKNPGELRVKEYTKKGDEGKWVEMCQDYQMVNGG